MISALVGGTPLRAVLALAGAGCTARSTPHEYPQPFLHDNAPGEPGFHMERRTRKAPLYTGVVLFAPAYALSVGVALSNPLNQGSAYLLVPVVGPIAAWGAIDEKYQCGWVRPTQPYDCNTSLLIPLVIDSAFQFAGAGLITTGILWKRKWWVVEDRGSGAMVPTFISNGKTRGIGLIGTF